MSGEKVRQHRAPNVHRTRAFTHNYTVLWQQLLNLWKMCFRQFEILNTNSSSPTGNSLAGLMRYDTLRASEVYMLNHLTAKLFNLNFHPSEAVSR